MNSQILKRANFAAIVAATAAVLFATSTMGQNQWTRQSPFPAARNLTGVAWATPTHGFASGERETFIETFDGGATWQNANLGISPTSDPFYNTYCRDADNWFVIGSSGTNGPDHYFDLPLQFESPIKWPLLRSPAATMKIAFRNIQSTQSIHRQSNS